MEKEIYNVLDKLEEKGYEAYIVGGFVREHLLKDKTYDIDITTSAKPREVLEIFKDLEVKLYDYGNVTFNIDKYKFDITTFRKDIKYKDNRKPEEIVYISSLEEDLKRRDFTINAICMDKNGNIIDYFNGIKDLKRRIIRSISDPDMKLKEDSLRILRAVRFATRYKFKIEKDLKEAIINNRDLLKNLSFERRKEELNKIFCSKYKKYGIKLLKSLKLDEALSLTNIDNAFLNNDLIGIWATITDEDYQFTKKEKDLINKIRELIDLDINDKYVQYKFGLYPLTIVSNLKKLNTKKIISKYESLPIKEKNEINITGDEMAKALNKEPGDYLKDITKDIEKKILYGDISNDKEAIIKYIKDNYTEG